MKLLPRLPFMAFACFALVACGGTAKPTPSSSSAVSQSSQVSVSSWSSIVPSSSSSISISSSSRSSSSISSSRSSSSVASSVSSANGAMPRLKGVSLSVAEFGEGKYPGVYDKDYAYPTQAEVDYFKSKKMNVVRLPFAWERLQPTLNQGFDATELGRLDGFVTQATAKSVYVVIDPHNYARYRAKLIGSADVPVSAFADFWTRLANQYKNNKYVVFAIMNEPNTMSTDDWVTAANAGAKAIRNTGATNLMLVPGNAWTGAHSWTQNWYGTANAVALLNFVDPGNNYAIEFHQYFDADKSGTKAGCSTSNGAEYLKDATNWLISNNKRGFLGEFAGDTSATCQSAVTGALQFMEDNKNYWIGWTWWAAGPWWGNYMYSIEPQNNQDAVQMKWLTPFLN